MNRSVPDPEISFSIPQQNHSVNTDTIFEIRKCPYYYRREFARKMKIGPEYRSCFDRNGTLYTGEILLRNGK